MPIGDGIEGAGINAVSHANSQLSRKRRAGKAENGA
jgi:hypothetical protein